MSVYGKIDIKKLKEFGSKLEKLTKEDMHKFNEQAVKELAARLLAKIIARTPVGKYEDKLVHFFTKEGEEVKFEAKANKTGGTLRRGWTAGKDIDPVTFAMSHLDVTKKGKTYFLIISNPVNYASYVEYGHRTRERTDGSRGWVEGKFMMTISEEELQEEASGILEKKLERFLEGYLNGDNS